jgi:hypothetical protein
MPYKINVNSNKNIVYLTAWGTIPPEEGMKCINEFTSKTQNINHSDYSLLLDGKGLEVSEENSAALLEGLLKTYIQFPFKKRFLAKCDSPIAQAQIKRLLRSSYNKYFIEVNTIEEAVKEIK